MVTWIKNTATVTASIYMALAAPVMYPTLAQEKSGTAVPDSPKVSADSFAPEVKPFPLEPDYDLQQAVAQRAKKIAEAKQRRAAAESDTTIPDSMSDSQKPHSSTRNEFENLTVGTIEPVSQQVQVDAGIEAPGLPDPAALIRPSEVSAMVLTDQPQATPDSQSVDLPPIIPAESISVGNGEAPTVIIRPPVDGPLTGCTLEVKKIGEQSPEEYAVLLQVPDSVKVIEVLPSQDVDSTRNFRLSLDQAPENEGHEIDHRTRTPALNVSSGQRVGQRQQYSMPNSVPQLRPIPAVEPGTPQRQGFQQNPFFKRPSSARRNETATQPILPESSETTSISDPADVQATQSIQVAYNSTNESSNPVAAVPFAADDDLVTERLPAVSSSVLNKATLTTQLSGPLKMELGATGDFIILVANPTHSTVKNVAVTLDLPDGLDVVVLDRQAWIDQEDRTVTWRLPTVISGDEVFIRYRVKATTGGDIQQHISMTTEGRLSDECGFETSVGPR